MQLPWFMHHDAYDYFEAKPPAPEIRDNIIEFLEYGYTIVKQSIARDFALECGQHYLSIKEANDSIFSPQYNPQGCIGRIVNIHTIYDKFAQAFGTSTRALAVQDYLFGVPTTLYTSLFFEQGTEQTIHRDTPVFCTIPAYYYMGMWTAFEDIDEDNGPLFLYKGGHLVPNMNRMGIAKKKYPDPNAIPDIDDDLWKPYQASVVEQCEKLGLKRITCPMNAGDVLIWHPQLPHGGSPQKDKSRTRLSFVCHTAPMRVPVYHMDAFFNPLKQVATRAGWNYVPIAGTDRFYADHGRRIDLNHKLHLAESDLQKVA